MKSKRHRDKWSYCTRNTEVYFMNTNIEEKYTCIECKHVGGQLKCPKCGDETVKVGPIARPPKKNASRTKWNEFNKHLGKYCAKGCR